MPLPRDLHILRPCAVDGEAVREQRLVRRAAVERRRVSSEEWNQPRCWSEPSRYRSAGKPSAAACEPRITLRCVEPGIEPDVQHVVDLFVLRGLRRRADPRRARATTPRCRRAPPLRGRSSSSGRRARVQLRGFLVQEKRQRHAPLRWRESTSRAGWRSSRAGAPCPRRDRRSVASTAAQRRLARSVHRLGLHHAARAGGAPSMRDEPLRVAR